MAADKVLELTEARRTVGMFERAEETLRRRLDNIGMSHWGAWLDYQRAALHLQTGETTDAEKPLARAYNYFKSAFEARRTAFDPSLGHNYCTLACIVKQRLDGELRGAAERLEQLDLSDGRRDKLSSLPQWICAQVRESEYPVMARRRAWAT